MVGKASSRKGNVTKQKIQQKASKKLGAFLLLFISQNLCFLIVDSKPPKEKEYLIQINEIEKNK